MKKLLSTFLSLGCLFVMPGVVLGQGCPSCPTYPTYPTCPTCPTNVNQNVQYVDSYAGNSTPSDAERFYVGGYGGTNWLNQRSGHPRIHDKRGYAGAISGGYKFDNSVRVEGEVAYRRNDYKSGKHSYGENGLKGHTSTWTYMGNVLYDFDQVSEYVPNVVPYVGVGAGYMHSDTHAKSKSDSRTARGNRKGAAAQAIAGVGYKLTDTTTLGVEYRYLVGKHNYKDHSVGLALRQAF